MSAFKIGELCYPQVLSPPATFLPEQRGPPHPPALPLLKSQKNNGKWSSVKCAKLLRTITIQATHFLSLWANLLAAKIKFIVLTAINTCIQIDDYLKAHKKDRGANAVQKQHIRARLIKIAESPDAAEACSIKIKSETVDRFLETLGQFDITASTGVFDKSKHKPTIKIIHPHKLHLTYSIK